MNIRFLGAVNGVTGSCHLIEFHGRKILLDCGLFQGKEGGRNGEDPEFDPADIDYLLLSHSHIDHSGRIPLLVKKGFRGKIYCSRPTYDLCEIMLLDSAHIQESEAEWENRKAKRSGKPLTEPLYTQDDARESMKHFKPVLYEQVISVEDGLTVRFRDAGHVLGSSIIEMWFREEREDIKIVYSGDLGTEDKPILKDPSVIDRADYVIMESTYGNRLHENVEKRQEELLHIILKTIMRKGTVIIPSFAVGRTQEIIYELNKYYDSHPDTMDTGINLLKKVPVYIDSPLAVKATEVFRRNTSAFDDEAKDYLMRGDHPLSFENLHFVQSVEESKALNFSDEPKIIISSSGMCDAGRIKHHLKHNLWKKNCSVVFVGYQAEGTLGRRIRDGAKNVKIFGEEIHINAEVYCVEGFSGHADKDGLLRWLRGFKKKPGELFLVHGEAESKTEFAREVEESLGIDCMIPVYNDVYEIKGKSEVEDIGKAKERLSPGKEQTEESIRELKEELQNLKKLFENSLDRTDSYMNTDKVSLAKYHQIRNTLLDLEHELLNLTALSGK